MKILKCIGIILFCVFPGSLPAAEVMLVNGDKVTGVVTNETETTLSIKTDAMGVITIKKVFVDRKASTLPEHRPESAPQAEEKDIFWQREVALGYNTSQGNTKTEELSAAGVINRNNAHVDEITLKGNLFYSSAKRKMDAQKWYTMSRYAFSFGGNKRAYLFFRNETDHDRFANVNYRTIPSAGIGYWIFDEAMTKLMGEIASGWEYTDYRDETRNDRDAIFIPRVFFEQKISSSTFISGDVVYYPIFEDFNDYRVRLEAIFSYKLDDRLSLRLSAIDNYDAKPAADTKKNDLRLVSSLAYSF